MKDIFDDFVYVKDCMDDGLEDVMFDLLEDARVRTEAVIDTWLDKMKYTDSVAYNRHIGSRTMEIYAHRPGILIGRGGSGVDEFKKLLNEEFGGDWHIKFIEIAGGFVGGR